MTKLSVLIAVNLLILVVQGQKAKLLTPEQGCGKTDKIITPRIVGGITAKNGAFPWMALIGYGYGPGYSFNCGGSLITARHVLTAAHCINGFLNFVRLGEHDLETDSDGPTQDIKVVNVDRHKKYDNSSYANDIAILTLERDVEFSDRIRPVCLPKDEPIRSQSFVGHNSFVAGWGGTAEGGQKATILQQLQVPVLPESDCRKQYWHFTKEDKYFICAGNLKGGEDSCHGDAGGPLMVPLSGNGTFPVYQIGVVSYGKGCARKDLPGVYTNVPQYMDWIQSKLNYFNYKYGWYLLCRSVHINTPVDIDKKMTKLSVFIAVNLLILVVQGPKAKLLTPEQGCGKTDKNIKPRIVGGVTAKNGAFPWMALIGYTYGGSLISSKHVLTAAHCINEKLKIVRLGEHDLTTSSDGPTQDIKVVRIDTHEKYDKRTTLNDIALLTLEREVQFSDRVRPVCLPKNEPIRSKSFVGYDTFVAGWGATAENGRQATTLQQLLIEVFPISVCQKKYPQVRGDKTQICAGNLKGGEDSCQGDSGGPLMVPLPVNGAFPVYQIGLVSFGRGCARKDLPGVYTNVPQYMDWITSKMN